MEDVSLKDMTTEEKREVLKELINKYENLIEREKKIIAKIEGELKQRKKFIRYREVRLKNYKAKLKKVV